MAIQFSTSVRNARLDAIEATVGASAKLQVWTGSAPADCATAATGTKLLEIDLPSDWMADAASGSKVKAGTWSGLGLASGTAGYFRVVNNAGTTCHIQGTCGIGTGDMRMDNTNIALNQSITVNTVQLDEPGA